MPGSVSSQPASWIVKLYELPRAIPGQLLLFEPPARSSSFDGAPVVVEPEQRSLLDPPEPDPERSTTP